MDFQLGEPYLIGMTREKSSPPSTTALVVALNASGQGTELTLLHPSGELSRLQVPTRADEAVARIDASAVRRPLAVRVAGSTPHQSLLLGTSRRGPIRRRVSLASALALCASGVHTVVVGGDPVNV